MRHAFAVAVCSSTLLVLAGCTGTTTPVESPAVKTPATFSARDIPLTPRAHMNAATLAVYNRIRTLDGWMLGVGALGGSEGRPNVPYGWAGASAAWPQLYGSGGFSAYEFEMGEANARVASRDWTGAASFSDNGGVPWFRISLNNFTVAWASNGTGGMNDTRNGLAPVLPGGSANAQFVAYMTTLAREIKTFGKPAVLRPFHEMNGLWFWWGGQSAQYRQLWALVFDIFRAEGVTNVIWAWAPSGYCVVSRGCDQLSYYPGDDVVDIVGTSNYFDAGSLPAESRQVVSLLEGIAADKPVMLTELGPYARADYWKNAPAEFATIRRFRGVMLWLARGWQAWGGDPARGSLVDSSVPQDVRTAFQGFLSDSRTISLDRWK